MSTLAIPLVPPEVDLRDFREMPLEIERLLASDTWVLGTPEEKVAAIHLWCKSWHQVPAGSLPDDDRILQHLSGAGQRWKKLRPHALRGWTKCTDGRFYHPVVAEKALRAWDAKLSQRMRTHQARIAALQKKIAAATGTEKGLLQDALTRLLQDGPGPVTGTKGREEKGREVASPSSLRSESSAGTTSSAAARRAGNGNGATVPIWQAYSEAYQRRYSVEPVRNAKVNGMLARFAERVPHDEAPSIAAFYLDHSRQDYVRSKHCVDMLLRDAEGLRTEWVTGRKVTDSEARRSDRSTATVDQINRMLTEAARGPA